MTRALDRPPSDDEVRLPPSLDDVEITRRPRLRYLIEGLLYRRTVVLLHGPPESAKTFFALHLAFCLATGRDFFGRAVKRRGGTYYICAEGEVGMRDRTLAWKAHHRDEADRPYSTTTPLGVEFHPEPINLLYQNQVDALVARLKPKKPILLVVDTLSKCSGGGDENTAKEMGIAVMALDRLRREVGCTVLALHHPGKNTARGARGSSALPAGIDTEIKVTRKGFDIHVECKKQKHGPHFDKFTVALKIAPFGELEDSCILAMSSIKPPSLTKLLAKEQRFDVLGILVERGKRGATHGELQKEPGIKPRNLNRALKALVAAGFVLRPEKKRGGIYHVTTAGKHAYREVAGKREKAAGA